MSNIHAVEGRPGMGGFLFLGKMVVWTIYQQDDTFDQR
jgi:hypothetical protein